MVEVAVVGAGIVCLALGWILAKLRSAGRVAQLEEQVRGTVDRLGSSERRGVELEQARERDRQGAEQQAERLQQVQRALAAVQASLDERSAQLEQDRASSRNRELQLQASNAELGRLTQRAAQAEALAASMKEQLSASVGQRNQHEGLIAQLRAGQAAAERDVAGLRAERAKAAEAALEMSQLREQTQEALRAQFETLSHSILEEKSSKFSEQSKQLFEQLLVPLRERIVTFEKRVEDTHAKDCEQHGVLKQELQRLQDMNSQLHGEARNLAKALTSQSQARGAWGELTLARVLERSGLVAGEAYELQCTGSVETEENTRQYRPDATIFLPESRHLIVDSKVTLNAFVRYSELEEGEERNTAMRDHLAAMRRHISELSEKAYAQIAGINSPDFVFMFVPLEGAFIATLQHDPEMFAAAFAKNIVVVAPSTLLASLRTVANLWRLERQNRNAREIASHAGRLYEKFVGFVGDLDKVGEHLMKAQNAFGEAQKKLSTGRGALTTQAERLLKLGAENPKAKRLPEKYLAVDNLNGVDEGERESA